jgi:drug/metabolite transporter (DMT)-like permease
MSSIWIKYLGFVTGMILAFIGAVFILGKLQESNSIVSGKMEAAEVSIKSSSLGIILVVLGTSLMSITLVMRHNVNVTDAAIYLVVQQQLLVKSQN